MSVIVSTDNYVEGYDIIEVGSEFEDSFYNHNMVPHDVVNRFLANITNEQERIYEEVVNKAIARAQSIASRNGWNAVLNFDIQFEEIGEWASINSVLVHIYGVLCYIEPYY